MQTVLSVLLAAKEGGDSLGGLGFLAAAVVTAIGASVGGTLLVAGPTRKNIASEATERAIKSIDSVRQSLEERLETVETELQTARTDVLEGQARIRELEHQNDIIEANRRAEVAELGRERDALKRQVESLQATVRDFERRLPERRASRRTE